MSYLKLSIIALFLINLSPSQAQLLSVGSGSLTILPGTEFSVDKLVLVPTLPYTLQKNNLELTWRMPTENGNSINRVYAFDNTPSPFAGKMMFRYQDKELNGVPENEVTIRVLESREWSALSTKTRSGSIRMMESSDMANTVPKAISLGYNTGKGDFEILNNPVTDHILKIKVHAPGELSMVGYNGVLLGKKYYAEGIHQIDLSKYAHSMYLLSSIRTTRKFIL